MQKPMMVRVAWCIHKNIGFLWIPSLSLHVFLRTKWDIESSCIRRLTKAVMVLNDLHLMSSYCLMLFLLGPKCNFQAFSVVSVNI